MDVLIQGGVVLTDGLELEADIYLRDGKVAAVGRGLDVVAAETIDAMGKFVLPGMVDLDALGDITASGAVPGEQLALATRNALRAGITTVCMDYNALQPAERAGEALRAHSRQNLVLRAAVPQPPARAAAAEAIRQQAVAGARVTMRRSGALGPLTPAELLAFLREVGPSAPVFVYPQEGSMGDFEQGNATRSSSTSGSATAMRQAMHPHYLGEAGLRLLASMRRAARDPRIVAMPITTREEVTVLASERETGGVPMMGVTALPYLIFSSEDLAATPAPGTGSVPTPGRLPAGYPPVRSRHDRLILWKALEAGILDAVATASSLAGDDLLGNPAYLLAALYTYGVRERRVPVATVISLVTDQPAKMAGIYPRKGSLLPGSDGDVVVFDPEQLSPAAAANSPWSQVALHGAIHSVIIGGNVVVRNGEAACEPPLGQLLDAIPGLLEK